MRMCIARNGTYWCALTEGHQDKHRTAFRKTGFYRYFTFADNYSIVTGVPR